MCQGSLKLQVSMVFQEVSKKLQGRFKSVYRRFQGHFKIVLRVFQGLREILVGFMVV